MGRMDFFKEGLKNLKTIGTVTPSSKYLCAKMVGMSDLSGAKCIVELGAGDGVMTSHILEKMPADAMLFAFEINPKFCELMRAINDPRLVVVEDSAEHLVKYIQEHGFTQIDVVFSALPFVVLPDEVSQSIVQSCYDFLKPLGQYFQVHYSLLEKQLYKRIFGNVNVTFQLLNIPPAFILTCSKII